jgi:hypothetical protein
MLGRPSLSLSTVSTATNTPRSTPRSQDSNVSTATSTPRSTDQLSGRKPARKNRLARVSFASQAEWIFFEDEDTGKETTLRLTVRFDEQARKKCMGNIRATWCPLGCKCAEHGGVMRARDVPDVCGHCPYQKPSPEFRRGHQEAVVGVPGVAAMWPATPYYTNGFVSPQSFNNDYARQQCFPQQQLQQLSAQQCAPCYSNDFTRQQQGFPQQCLGSSNASAFQTMNQYGTWANQQPVPVPINAVFPNAQSSRRLLTVF